MEAGELLPSVCTIEIDSDFFKGCGFSLAVNARGSNPAGSSQLYCSGDHAWHSETLTGNVSGGPVSKRTTPSEVEQKLRVPVLPVSGVPTTTNSSHFCFL